MNGVSLGDDPEHLPSDKDLCPATLSRASGSGLRRLHGLATAKAGSRLLLTWSWIHQVNPRPSQAPVHMPRCQRGHASLSLGVARRLLQPETTRGHTLRAINPRARVELSLRCSLAPTDASCVGFPVRRRMAACEPRSARGRLSHVALPLSWHWADHGPKRSSEGANTRS